MLKIYDTLTKSLREFKPIKDKVVTFYHCGPTVYWIQHIGNMRGMTMADLIHRSLIYLGYDVKFARNYTDVGHLTGDNIGDADIGEDRMEKASKREGVSPEKIANKYIIFFDEDLKALNHLPIKYHPRATEYIKQMQNIVSILLEKGYAYTTPKAVYFDVSKKEDYTKLSGQKMNFNKEGAGSGDVGDPDKRNPQDFALWFFKTGVHSNALQTWPSTFVSPEVKDGEGFPGWHLECSTMAMDILGETIDIHMGGIEHIPIHHTNEIAQSESATGNVFVNYWLHNEHLTVDNEKMAKSVGNVYSVQDIIDKGYDPLALRYFFLNSHYRSKQNFTFEALDASRTAYEKLKSHILQLEKGQMEGVNLSPFTRGRLEGVVQNPVPNDHPSPLLVKEGIWKSRFIKSLEDDFNISKALAVTWEVAKSDLPDSEKLKLILDFDRVLGLNLDKVEEKETKIPEEVQKLLDHRARARKEKNWMESDRIRDEIKGKYGLEVKDTEKGQEI